MAAATAVDPVVGRSSFVAHLFAADVNDSKFNYRILRMQDALFVYVGPAGSEDLNEMAMAMPDRTSAAGEPVSTKILGPLDTYTSEGLAQKLAKLLRKQVYVSYNVPHDRMTSPLIERRLFDEIKTRPDMFC